MEAITIDRAIAQLTKLKESLPGDTAILDPDGFAVSGFYPFTFTEEDKGKAKELQCEIGDTIIEVSSAR